MSSAHSENPDLLRKASSYSSHRRLAPPRRAEPREIAVLDEISFRETVAVERKRTERSRTPTVLMLLDTGEKRFDGSGVLLTEILSALSVVTRDTDVIGWYSKDSVLGVIFTEIHPEHRSAILGTLMTRMSQNLQRNLSLTKLSQFTISFHVFPEDWVQEDSAGDPALYPDLLGREQSKRGAFAVKRLIDIAGSLAAIVLGAPLFLLLALVVKLGSNGDVLYRQERLGQFGKPFTFLKFRTMYMNNDPKIHREFMKRVISGQHDGSVEGGNEKVYKMTHDPRITRVGRLLRRTSLDEIPQFFNVLRGDMSLVGPRPPLAYECQEYDIWHRRRVLEARPGITGLWQISGRSRISFDDMVRLDLQYVRRWSLWLDLKILAKTPLALFRGGDAF